MEPVFFDLTVEDEGRRVCLVDLPQHRTPDELADLLVAQHPRRSEQTELVVLRPAVDTALAKVNRQDYAFDTLIRRTPRAEIRILHSSSFKHRLSQNLVSTSKEVYSARTLARLVRDIREKELEYYAVNSDGLLSARAGFVYRAPSDHYVRQFLRVGNIQKSRYALDAVFFWMLPYMEQCRAIVVDTWSISSIALNAARLLEKYRSGTECRVDFLPAYFDGGRDGQEKARAVLQYAWRGEGLLLVLFSAVRSGRSFNRLRAAFEKVIPRENIRYLAIYSLGAGVGIDALCTELQGFEDAERDGSVITIDPSSFFPVTARDKPLLIRKVDSQPNRPFFRRYKGAKAIRIHRDVRDSTGTKLRHHAFDIDVEMLLAKRNFRTRLRNALKGLSEPSIVVVPCHRAGAGLGEVARGVVVADFGRSVEVFCPSGSRSEGHCGKECFSQDKLEYQYLGSR